MMIRLFVVLALFAVAQPAAKADNTLWALNAQRAYFGLPALRPDPQLQQAAEWAAHQRSLRGMNGHLRGGRPVAGKLEGTARRNSRQRGPAGEYWGPEDVYACYQATGGRARRQQFSFGNATYAGCASVMGRDGYWYYQINLR